MDQSKAFEVPSVAAETVLSGGSWCPGKDGALCTGSADMRSGPGEPRRGCVAAQPAQELSLLGVASVACVAG